MNRIRKRVLDNLTGRKALMTLIAFGMVILVCLIAGSFRPLEANLPTVLGTIVAILTVFVTGHAVDNHWTPSTPPRIETKSLPAAAKAAVAAAVKVEAKHEEKKAEEEEDGS